MPWQDLQLDWEEKKLLSKWKWQDYVEKLKNTKPEY